VTIAGRVGATACEASVWESTTSLACFIPSGVGAPGFRSIVTVGLHCYLSSERFHFCFETFHSRLLSQSRSKGNALIRLDHPPEYSRVEREGRVDPRVSLSPLSLSLQNPNAIITVPPFFFSSLLLSSLELSDTTIYEP